MADADVLVKVLEKLCDTLAKNEGGKGELDSKKEFRSNVKDFVNLVKNRKDYGPIDLCEQMGPLVYRIVREAGRMYGRARLVNYNWEIFSLAEKSTEETAVQVDTKKLAAAMYKWVRGEVVPAAKSVFELYRMYCEVRRSIPEELREQYGMSSRDRLLGKKNLGALDMREAFYDGMCRGVGGCRGGRR